MARIETLPLVSADDHLQEPFDLWERGLPPALREAGPRLVPMPGGGEGFQIGDQPPRPLGILVSGGRPDLRDQGLTWADVPRAGYDPAARLEALDADGVAASVLYPNVCLDPMMDQVRLPGPVAGAVYRVYNDHLSAFCQAAPERLAGVALLPLHSVEEAVAELERVAALPGIRGALLPVVPPEGREYNDPAFDRLWAAAGEVGLPLSIHAGRPRALPTRHEVLRRPGGAAVYMHLGPFSIAEAFAYIMWAGVFDRFPGVRMVAVEGSIGWLAFYKERAQLVFERHGGWTGHGLRTGPAEWFGRNLFATFGEDPVGLATLDFLGAEMLLWASDFPHSETTWPRSREVVARAFAGVPREQARAILRGNASRLYGLPWDGAAPPPD